MNPDDIEHDPECSIGNTEDDYQRNSQLNYQFDIEGNMIGISCPECHAYIGDTTPESR